MNDIGYLLQYLFQQIYNTWQYMEDIEFLGTNLLQVSVGFLIANALVSLMIVVNKSSNRSMGK